MGVMVMMVAPGVVPETVDHSLLVRIIRRPFGNRPIDASENVAFLESPCIPFAAFVLLTLRKPPGNLSLRSAITATPSLSQPPRIGTVGQLMDIMATITVPTPALREEGARNRTTRRFGGRRVVRRIT